MRMTHIVKEAQKPLPFDGSFKLTGRFLLNGMLLVARRPRTAKEDLPCCFCRKAISPGDFFVKGHQCKYIIKAHPDCFQKAIKKLPKEFDTMMKMTFVKSI